MLNHVVIMGRFVRDPELRRTDSGKAVASFTISVAWEKRAEFIDNYFAKGSAIIVEGRLESRQYETKDGQKRTVHEVVVSQAHFCEKKKEDEPKAPATFTMLDDDSPLPL